jgi:hypothetical protein
VVFDISKKNGAFIFQGEAPSMEYLTYENEGTISLQNTRNHSPNDIVSHAIYLQY